jgi:hypothetical protein
MTTPASALFSRFPDLALAVPPTELQPIHSFISNGHSTLRATLDHQPAR